MGVLHGRKAKQWDYVQKEFQNLQETKVSMAAIACLLARNRLSFTYLKYPSVYENDDEIEHSDAKSTQVVELY